MHDRVCAQYALVGGRAFYVEQSNKDVSYVLDAAGQRCWGCCACTTCMSSSAVNRPTSVSKGTGWNAETFCSRKCCTCDFGLPEGSLSRCCLAGGSSVSQGVSWLMGVCPHLTPGASSSPGVWLSPGERPETCRNRKHRCD